MVQDYQGNSDKAKKKADAPDKPEIQKVATNVVITKKPSIGQRIKNVFIQADFGSVAKYVVSDVLIPAARTMIVEASTRGIERMMYGESTRLRRPPGRGTTYGGSPMAPRTDYRHPATRPPSQLGSGFPRPSRNDFILETKEEATEILEMMREIVDMYEEVSVANYHEMLGVPSTHVDEKWGWTNLLGSGVRQVRDGFMIDLPQAQPI